MNTDVQEIATVPQATGERLGLADDLLTIAADLEALTPRIRRLGAPDAFGADNHMRAVRMIEMARQLKLWAARVSGVDILGTGDEKAPEAKEVAS